MTKLTSKMHLIGLRGGYDLWEDEDFLYLTDEKGEIVATFSSSIKTEALKLATTAIQDFRT